MRLKFEPFDGRSRGYRDIVDEETGKTVGHIRSNGVGFGNSGGIQISLFGGKYEREVNSFEECWGFVRGVQAVLNHVIRFQE